MPDTNSRIEALAAELRDVIKNAFADSEALAPLIPHLLALHRIEEEVGRDADPLEKVAALRSVVLPDYLARLGTTNEAEALREMFVLRADQFRTPTLADLYYKAVDHLDGVTIEAFERRRLPKLLHRFAGCVMDFDASDRRAARHGGSIDCERLWGFTSRAPITLVFPEIPAQERLPFAKETVSDHLRLLKFADIDTLFELKTFLSRQFPSVDVREHVWTDVPREALREDVVIVGGIAWNGLTADLLDRVKSPIKQMAADPGQPDYLYNVGTGAEYVPAKTASNMISGDYGLFVRAPNPLSPTHTVTIINGVLTHGVLGAAKSFGTADPGPRNCAFVLRRLIEEEASAFAALIHVDVVANHVPVPSLETDALVEFHLLS